MIESGETKNQQIKIACRGAESLPLDAIKEFQGSLKRRSKKDIDLIVTSIEKFGFSFPFFVWQNEGRNYCLDGHGRIQALRELRRRGVSLPLFPVVYVDAADEAEAKQKLLRLNSQYGSMTKASVLEFASGLEIDDSEIQLPSGTLNLEDGQGRDLGDIPFPEVLGEENNYIVLKFNTDIDFLNAQTLLGLKSARSFSTKRGAENGCMRVGIGRVVDGVAAIGKIRGEG